MNRLLIFMGSLLLPACSTLNDYGIGGPPALYFDTKGRAVLDDPLIGSGAVRLSVVRRFPDGDRLHPAAAASAPKPAGRPAAP